MRFANGYYMGEITSIHLGAAISLAMYGANEYGTDEELVMASMDPDYFPEPAPHLQIRRFKRAAKRKSHTDGTSSTSLSKEQLSRASLKAASKGLPSASQEPSLKASLAAKSMTTLELLQKRRLRLAAISAASEQDGADNLNGLSVENTATNKGSGK